MWEIYGRVGGGVSSFNIYRRSIEDPSIDSISSRFLPPPPHPPSPQRHHHHHLPPRLIRSITPVGPYTRLAPNIGARSGTTSIESGKCDLPPESDPAEATPANIQRNGWNVYIEHLSNRFQKIIENRPSVSSFLHLPYSLWLRFYSFICFLASPTQQIQRP